MRAEQLVSYLLELNVLNVQEIERHLRQMGARARYPQVKKWLLTVARKYLLNKLKDDEQQSEYEQVSRRPRRRDQFTTYPEEMPEWASREMAKGGAVHFFRDLQPRQRQLWNDIDTIIDWFNYSFKPDDPVLNRLDRISFDQARALAVEWRKHIDENPFEYSKDRPPVVRSYEDGYRWVQLTKPRHLEREGYRCEKEGPDGRKRNMVPVWSMGHCISGYANQLGLYDIYSLRDPNNNPHVTMAVNKGENTTSQVKGRDNARPINKYQPYILDFIKEMGIRLSGDAHNVGIANSDSEERTGEFVGRY